MSTDDQSHRTLVPWEEEALLGALLLDRRQCVGMSDHVDRTDFATQALAEIFQVLVQSDGEPDVAEIRTHLAQNGILDPQAAGSLLARLLQSECSGFRAVEHALAVREAAQRRRMASLGQELTTAAQTSPEPPEAIIERIGSRIFEVAGHRQREKVIAVGDALAGVIARMTREQATDGGVTGIDSGFAQLNLLTGGWQPGAFNVIAARPSKGKTTLAMNAALRASRDGQVVYFVTAEMSASEITRTVLCNIGGVSSSVLRTGRLTTIDWQRITDAAESVRNLKLLLDASAAPTPAQIRNQAKRVALQHGRLDLIIVDYLQLVRGPRAETREQE